MSEPINALITPNQFSQLTPEQQAMIDRDKINESLMDMVKTFSANGMPVRSASVR